MNTGLKLEQDFVKSLNSHNYNELSLNLKKFIKFLFDNVNAESKIYCEKMDNHQKADILIKINNKIKYVSLKTGSQNSVHVEKIESFVFFLLEQGIKKYVIDNLLLYHYGDDTLIGNGKIRWSADEAKIKYKQQISQFNKNINYSKILPQIVERFLFTGSRDSNKRVDAIYYGDIDIGTWCSSSTSLNYCMQHKSMYMNTPHFSFLTYQNWRTNISFLKKSESHRQYIQIKWFSILSDIKKIR